MDLVARSRPRRRDAPPGDPATPAGHRCTPPGLRGEDAGVADGVLWIEWADAPPATEATRCRSVLPVPFLAALRVAGRAEATIEQPTIEQPTITLWDASTIGDHVPTVSFEAVMTTEHGVAEWLRKTTEYGWCLAVGTPATPQASVALLRRVGYLRETIFGAFWDFTADLAKADTAYTNLALRPHTDGTYSHDAPGVQLLHCLSFDGTGGESIVVDGFRIAARLSAESPAAFATLARVIVPGQYIGDGSHLIAARPVLRHDHSGTLVQVSFNNYDRAPFLLPADEMIEFYDALRAFELLANDPANQWRHTLAPGEALLFDNWRVLHGRAAYTGNRRMCGAYVNREDVESRLRIAAATSPAASGGE